MQNPGSNLESSRKKQLKSMPTTWLNSSNSAGEEENIKDTVFRQFFLIADEERSNISGGNAVGFAQPVNLSGAVLPSFSSSSPSLCFHLKPSTKHRGHAPSYRKARELRYTSVRPNQVFSIDISGYSCQVFDHYQSGSWMPTGSPPAATLQVATLKTIARGIVFFL